MGPLTFLCPGPLNRADCGHRLLREGNTLLSQISVILITFMECN